MTEPDNTGQQRGVLTTNDDAPAVAAPVPVPAPEAAREVAWRWPAPGEERLGPRRYTRLTPSDDMDLDRAANWSRMSPAAFIRRAVRQEVDRIKALMRAEEASGRR